MQTRVVIKFPHTEDASIISDSCRFHRRIDGKVAETWASKVHDKDQCSLSFLQFTVPTGVVISMNSHSYVYSELETSRIIYGSQRNIWLLAIIEDNCSSCVSFCTIQPDSTEWKIDTIAVDTASRLNRI